MTRKYIVVNSLWYSLRKPTIDDAYIHAILHRYTCWWYDEFNINSNSIMYCKAFCNVFTFDTRFERTAIDGIASRSRTKASFTARTRYRSRALRFSTDIVDSNFLLLFVDVAWVRFCLKLLRFSWCNHKSLLVYYIKTVCDSVYLPDKYLLDSW